MIPKIVHVCWDDKNVLEHPSPLIQHGLKKIQDLNPDWTIHVNSESDVDLYLQSVLSVSDWNLLSHTHIVERSDLWRLFKIFREGGVYTDIDRLCNTSFADIADSNIRWVLPTQNEFDFSQDFMMSSPGNPAFEAAINMVLERRRTGHTNTYYLGPQTYMHAVTRTICGAEINTNPGAETFEQIRAAIAGFSFIRTYRENGPYDSVIYRPTGEEPPVDFAQAKRELYHSYGITHWTEA